MERYDVRIPADFVRHMRTNPWRAPVPERAQLSELVNAELARAPEECDVASLNDRFPPERVGAWIELSAPARAVWLQRVRGHYFANGHRTLVTKPAGSVIRLDCATISDVDGFWCSLGEAVQGPGGYFGSHIQALDDCLVGGFGLVTPCVLRLSDEARLAGVLDGNALASWARKGIDDDGYVDEQGRLYLLEAERAGVARERTLWGALREVFAAHRVEVVDESAPST